MLKYLLLLAIEFDNFDAGVMEKGTDVKNAKNILRDRNKAKRVASTRLINIYIEHKRLHVFENESFNSNLIG